MRLKVIKAITEDASLQAIAGRNGRGPHYRGLANSIDATDGEMRLLFSISYPLIPTEL
jgi:hypothetical protein